MKLNTKQIRFVIYTNLFDLACNIYNKGCIVFDRAIKRVFIDSDFYYLFQKSDKVVRVHVCKPDCLISVFVCVRASMCMFLCKRACMSTHTTVHTYVSICILLYMGVQCFQIAFKIHICLV